MTMSTVNEISISYSPKMKTTFGITFSRESAQYLMQIWEGIEVYESFNVLFLNQANKVKGYYQLSKGGISSTIVDIRILFAIALKSLSTAILLAHNHPSGRLKPSLADDKITKKIKETAAVFDIAFLDHLIIAPNGQYYSYADNCLI